MSEGLNLVTLLGNLGADPELKSSAKGPVLKMRLATEHSFLNKEKNEREKRTEWHTLTMFGARAEALARLLHKGERIMVTGRLQTNDWEKDGQKHYRTEIIVDDLCFAGGTRANGAYTHAPREALTSADLPF
jgi:single-strand DNA-binding protein